MPAYNTDYLKFDAITIKNAIVQKLSEDSDFTDQLFEGSNLVAIIDVFSHLFEVLTYYVNHGASEAMFSDSTLYENMNRLVKLLGYNPIGGLSCRTTVSFQDSADAPSGTIFDDTSSQKEIPKYASMSTGLTDTAGNTVYYSLVDRLFVNKTNPASEVNTFTAINGKWKLYERTFISNGTPFEEFVLDELPVLGVDSPNYIAHPYVDIYVKTVDDDTGETVFDEYDAISDGTIFGTTSTVLGPDTKKFELRINENGYYAIKFGDGIHGRQLKDGDEIYVIYLEGNGPDGEIGVNQINSTGVVTWGITGLDQDIFMQMIGLDPTDTAFLVSDTEMDNLLFQNITASTTYTEPEDVDSMRENAPSWFKSNNRLVSADDFDQYMRTIHGSDIYDVLTMNNWGYMSTFYKWLYDYDKLEIDIRKNGYPYVDACDFNNVYIWLKYRTSELDESLVQEELQSRKVLTAEPKLVTALDTKFVPCLNFDSDTSLATGYSNLKYNINAWDPNIENWIEIIKDKNTFISAERIRSRVLTAIQDFFDPEYNELGMTISFNDLYSRLLSIDGVYQVRTAYLSNGSLPNNTVYFNGLSFAKWTPVIAEGRDVELVKGTVILEDFQFPLLVTDDLNDRIKIVSESFGQASIEY